MTSPLGTFLDDIQPGATLTTSTTTITLDDVKQFAASYDPQPMHLDADAGAGSIFGHLVASGWQTLALTMRLMVEARPFGETPIVGVGVDDVRFRAPVLPGTTIRATAVVAGVRRRAGSRSGFVTLEVTTEDVADGRIVLTQKWTLLVPARREGGREE